MPRREPSFRLRRMAMALLIAALQGACSDIYYDRREGVSFQAGNAVASNVAVETIDPWPAAAANREIAGNGQRVQGAIERYRNNKVTPPQGTGTSSVKYEPILAAPAAPAASGGGPNP
jgi:hypothetical protein